MNRQQRDTTLTRAAAPLRAMGLTMRGDRVMHGEVWLGELLVYRGGTGAQAWRVMLEIEPWEARDARDTISAQLATAGRDGTPLRLSGSARAVDACAGAVLRRSEWAARGITLLHDGSDAVAAEIGDRLCGVRRVGPRAWQAGGLADPEVHGVWLDAWRGQGLPPPAPPFPVDAPVRSRAVDALRDLRAHLDGA